MQQKKVSAKYKKCHVDQLIDSSKLKYIAICWEIYLFFLYKW